MPPPVVGRRGVREARRYRVRGRGRRGSGANAPEKKAPDAAVDADGAPRPGSKIERGARHRVRFEQSHRARAFDKVKGADGGVVDRVALMHAPGARGKKETKMSVTMRFNRNPIIGDKFSSRHGQKGVLSFLWPENDMPYCERTGVRPDILDQPARVSQPHDHRHAGGVDGE